MSKIHSAADIYRDKGVIELILSIQRYLKNQVLGIVEVVVNDGDLAHEIGGTDVIVPVKTEWQRNRFVKVHNERELLEEIVNELEKDDVFYDIGSYLGWHSLTAKAVIEDGDVIAFEPHPVSYERLSKVINDTSMGNFQAYNVGLSDSQGCASMSSSSKGGSRIHSEEQENKDLLSINTVVGDEFITENNLPYPTVLKIDVEGWEAPAIRGLKNTINMQECRVVYCEIHPQKAEEEKVRDVVTNLLTDASFKITEVPHVGSKSIIKAKKS